MAAELPPDYPARLLCNGRPADPEFLPTEELYFRIPALQAGEESTDFVPPGTIRSLPFSVNRQKHSDPHDVIIGYPNCGIAVLRVQDVPTHLKSDTGIRFDFVVEHMPVDDEEANNYAHTEVKVFRDGKEVNNKALGNKVKAAFREMVSQKTRVLLRPTLPTEVAQ